VADVEGNVEITVEGEGGLAEAAEAARNLADALKDDEAAAAGAEAALDSLGAAGAGLAEDAAEADALAESLGHVRDEAAEAAVAEASLAEAQGRVRDSAAEQDAALAGSAAQYAQMADAVRAAKDRYAEYGASMTDAKQAETDAAAISKDLSDGNLGLAQSSIAATDAITESDKAIASANQAYREADNYISAAEGSLDKAADSATNASGQYAILGARVRTLGNEMQNFSDVARDATSTDDDFSAAAGELGTEVGRVGQSVGDTRAAFGDFKGTAQDAASGLRDMDAAAKDAGDGFDANIYRVKQSMADLGPSGFVGGALNGWRNLLQGAGGDLEGLAVDAGDAGEGVGGFGESISEATAPITSKLSPMTAGIGALIGLVGGLGPAFGTAFAGGAVSLGGFAALALPTLSKIESSYENVASARKTWTAAEQLAQADPTKTNLEDAATDAAKLKIAYADVPAAIRPVITAFGNLKTQYDAMAKSFQPEVLKVTGDALSAASEGMSQFLKPAAELGGGLVDKGIKNLQTFMESPGAVKTFNDLMKETPGAIKSVGSAASSVGKFLGDAFGGVGVKGSESFIKSFDNFLKAIGPGTGTVVKGLAGGLKDVMNDATLAAPQIGKIAGSLGGLEKVNLSSLEGQLKSIVNLGNTAGGGKAGSKGGLFGGFIGDLDQFEKDWDVTFPKSWNVGGKLGAAAKQAASDMIPGLGSGLKPQTLHLPVTVDPKVDVKGGHLDTSALEHQLGGGTGLPLPVKVEPKVDPGAMARSLNLGGPKVPVPAEAKVDKADTSGLKGGDTKVPATAQVDKVDTSGINKAASNVKIHGVTVDLSDAKLSGLTALSSSLQSAGSSAGRSFDTGLSSGISGGAGQAEAAAQHVVAEIKSALSQLGGDGSAAGDALGQGLASGIAASTGAAVAAARTMANEVTAAVKAAHATASPSKVFKGIGTDDVKGLILGLEGGKSELATAAKDMAAGVTAPFKDTEITDTIRKLETDLKDSLKAGTISPTEDTGVSAWLAYDNKRLMNLASQRKNIEAAITAADSLYKSVDQATVQGANVATFASNAASGGSATTDNLPGAPDALAQWQATGGQGTSIQDQLKQYLAQTRAFTGDVKKLKAEGLDQTSMTQLLQAGVSGGGLSGAKMLLSGGPQGVKEVASLQNQIAAAAKQLGVTGANAAYESGSQIGGGLASGLKAELGSVTDAIKSLATSIVDEMQKGLSSGALENIGKDWASQIAKGMAGGGSGGGGGGGAHATPILAAAGGGGGGTLHIHLNVGGTEIAQAVQTYTLQHARRNTGSGLQLKGRGT
jgi:hypothetical protein